MINCYNISAPRSLVETSLYYNSENPGVVAADNNFSNEDKWAAYNNKVDGYVTTPNGSLKKYNYKTTRVTVVSTDMPSDTRYPKLRKNKIDYDKLPKNESSL